MNGHIAESRARHRQRLNARVRFSRAGAAVHDWDAHRAVAQSVTVWEGPCAVTEDSGRSSGRSSGGDEGDRQLTGRAWVVEVPVDGTGVIARGDEGRVLEVNPTEGDPSIVGVPLTVDRTDERTRMVLRRLRCVDTAPSEARLP